MSFERFVRAFKLFSSLFNNLWSRSSGLLLLPPFSSSFRAVCSLFSSSRVSFDIFWSLSSGYFRASFRAVCYLFSNPQVSVEILVSFERFAPSAEILTSLASELLLVLKCSTSFRAVCFLFSTSNLSRNSLVSFERFAPSSANLDFPSSGLLLVFKVSSLFRNSLGFLPAHCSMF